MVETERRAETRAQRAERLRAEQVEHTINVKAVSNVRTVGQYIAMWCRDNPGKRMQLRMVGAGAVNQAVKSVAKATQMLARQNQLDLISRTSFTDGSPDERGVVPSVVVLTLEALA